MRLRNGWLTSLAVVVAVFGVDGTLFEHHSNVSTFDFTNRLREIRFQRDDKIVLLHNYGDAILVGGRNAAYNVSLRNMAELGRYEWPTGDSSRRNCETISAQPRSSCDNFLRTFFELPPTATNRRGFILCGTHGLQPACAEFTVGNSMPIRTISGAGLAPIDADAVAPFLRVDDQLFSANVPELSSSEPLLMRRNLRNIARGIENDVILRTPRGQSAFEQASFIALEKNKEEVLSFFVETPMESEGCGLRKVARVGRVCVQDPGGKLSYAKEWTSFAKARLECAIEEEDQDTLYFNQLSSVASSKENFYGAFRSQLAGIGASAVCRFGRTAISKTIAGAYKSASKTDGTCPRATTLDEFSSMRLRPLVKSKITSKPVFVHHGKDRFVHILTQEGVQDLNDNYYDVLYIATNKGNIFKVVLGVDDEATPPSSRHALTLHVFKPNTKVLAMMVYTEPLPNRMNRQFLVVLTPDSIVKMPTTACDEAKTCAECLAMGDPECAWIEDVERCVKIRENLSRKMFASQDSGTCPAHYEVSKPLHLPPLQVPNVQPTCLCESTSTKPCTTEVIQREIVRDAFWTSGIWKCVTFFAAGLVCGAVLNCFAFHVKDRMKRKPSLPSISPIDAFSSTSRLHQDLSVCRFNSGSMHSSIQTYC